MLSSLCRGDCLRRDNRATAIVTAAARIARPMTWPPISRTVSGRPAEISVVLTRRWCLTCALAALGEGDTVGNADPRLPAGFVTPGKVVLLPGKPTGGSVPPLPAFGVGVGVGDGEFAGLTWTVAVAEAELIA